MYIYIHIIIYRCVAAHGAIWKSPLFSRLIVSTPFESICMCVCMYMHVHIYTHIYVSMCISVYMYTGAQQHKALFEKRISIAALSSAQRLRKDYKQWTHPAMTYGIGEWVISHRSTSHVTQIIESCHTSMSHVTYQWIMSRINESRHIHPWHRTMHTPCYDLWHRPMSHMGWLRLVDSLKLYVSFAECSLFHRTLLQKRPVIWRSLLIVATPCHADQQVMSHNSLKW